MTSENNSRIAKNTMMLYFRMLLTLLVSLFTVRVVLNTLGVVDYGIYNVVGGMVAMFSFLSGTMASASQRFFAFEIGKNDTNKLKTTFGVTLTIYIVIALVLLLISETVGLWFLENKMEIPPERHLAAKWVYHLSILSFIITILTIPYQALIIAYEKMKVYAYVSIIEVLLKLLVVYFLLLFSFDKLILYAILMLVATTIITFLYRTYCKRRFEEATFSLKGDKKLFWEILNYSGWNIIGSLSIVMKDQGVNILLNVFFNPAINAARGIAFQVNSVLLNFSNNFYTAVRPQVTKSYASGDMEYMRSLVFRSSKIAFFLILILAVPLLFETHYILDLWLKEVPDHVVIFTRLVIINSLIDVLNLPLVAAIQATGRMKLYQSTVAVILLLNLPISFVFLKYGFSPEITMIISICISVISFVPRLLICQRTAKLPIVVYLKEVILNVLLVSVLSFSIILVIYLLYNESQFRLIIIGISSMAFTPFFVFRLGFKLSERRLISNVIKKRILNIIK